MLRARVQVKVWMSSEHAGYVYEFPGVRPVLVSPEEASERSLWRRLGDHVQVLEEMEGVEAELEVLAGELA